MSFRTRYAIDNQAAENGIRVPFGDGIFVTGRRTTSRASQEARAEAEKPYRGVLRSYAQRGADAPAAITREITNKQLAFGTLIDWEGVTDESNQPIPFSAKAALDLFERYPDFRDDCLLAFGQQATFAAAGLEDDAKNSAGGSATSSNGEPTSGS